MEKEIGQLWKDEFLIPSKGWRNWYAKEELFGKREKK